MTLIFRVILMLTVYRIFMLPAIYLFLSIRTNLQPAQRIVFLAFVLDSLHNLPLPIMMNRGARVGGANLWLQKIIIIIGIKLHT